MSRQSSSLIKCCIAGLAACLFFIASDSAKAQWPDAREAKAIAEEGFIYGLPIVMNYAVMYEYSVDKNSGQYKAPFNQIKNEARVFTYRTPLSSRPIATRLIRCYGSICALNRL